MGRLPKHRADGSWLSLFYHRGLAAAAVGVLAVAPIVGCKNASSLPSIELERSESKASQPLSADPPPGATRQSWSADAARLPIDVGRAIDSNHWGRLTTRFWQSPAGATQLAGPRVVVRATALLPDGRQAEIVAWALGADRVEAAVRVGQFGDAEEERGYLAALQDVLAGDPKRERHKKFTLPE